VPVEQYGEARIGSVQAVGDGVKMKNGTRRLDCAVGDRILYSARVDSYPVGGERVDLIEEASIIGVMHGDQ
jgi:co-chaperonin GroES (HSP10)